MTRTYDVAVAGLGAMGSAIALHAARRGLSVLGFDRHRPPHRLGSSHGGTRIIREAYFEDPVYVPLVRRAYELWADLERESGVSLYLRTGGLMIGRPDSVLVEGSLRSAREHGLAHEVIDAASIRARFPAFNPEDDMVGVFEPRAGILFPERCVAIQLAIASKAGAELRFDEPVDRWSRADDGSGEAAGGSVRIDTAAGTYRARRLVIAAGAWTDRLLPAQTLPVEIERQTLYWFRAEHRPENFASQHCPIHLWQFDRNEFFYGFPDVGEGVKLARHHRGATADPDAIDRVVSDAEVADIRELAARFTPDANGALLSTATCMYTNTPDEHFRIDWLDADAIGSNVLVVSACSGHGFKFAPAIGEIAADLLDGRTPRFDLSLFRLDR